ncbi:MAG: universal stress protein [Pseudomonadales bacterium]|nr:universal stress protein [Pseudomonadales bacterium]
MSATDAIPMVKRILYATDLGIYGPYLLEHVSELAERYKAKVVVVHAIEPLSPFADAVLEAYVPDNAKESLKGDGIEHVLDTIRLKVMAAFEDDFIDYQGDRDWLEDVLVVAGRAPEVILQQAREQSADMIVIGSHGSGRLNNNYTSIGSVASKVLQLSEVPVYLVPTQTKRQINQTHF